MRLVYISKYTVFPEHGSPTRQYFLAKEFSRIGDNEALLIGSRSSIGEVPSFKGSFIKSTEGRLHKLCVNGPLIDLGFNLKRLFSWGIFELNLFRTRSEIKSFKPDVIVVSSLSILTFLSGVFLKFWLKVPLVIEIRDIYPLTLMEIGKLSPRHPAVKVLGAIEKLGYRKADLIISSLPNVSEHIRAVSGREVPFKWIPMGIDPGFFKQTGDKPLFKLRKTEKEFLVCYAGTLGEANALDTVFQAAQKLEQSFPHIKFVFIGNGPLKEHYKAEFGGLKNVRFYEAVPKEDLMPLLQQADLLVNCWKDLSLYRFGVSPNKWMDYMYAAKPILVSYSGHKCIIDKAGCGFFVRAERLKAFVDGILYFSVKTKEDLRKIGLRGRAYVLEHHQYSHLASTLLNSLNNIVNQPYNMNRIKFAVVGVGAIGKRHAFMVNGNPGAELVALIDPNESTVRGVSELSGVPVFADVDDFIKSGIKADVVNICTPNGLHASLAIKMLRNSNHVVIEKPMGLSKQECEEVVFTSLQASRQVFVVKQNRYSPPSKWMKEVVANKIIGDVLMVQVNCYWNRDERYYKPGGWKGTSKLDGGTLFTQFSHFIDIMYWVFGDIKDIKSSFSNFTHQDTIEFEDSGLVQFEFVKGGVGCINFSTSVWETNMESSITVVGSKGSFKIGGQYMNEVEYCHIKDYEMPELEATNPPNDYGPFKGSAANHHYVIENVVNTLNGKDTITANGMEGMKVVDIIERIYQAGRPALSPHHMDSVTSSMMQKIGGL